MNSFTFTFDTPFGGKSLGSKSSRLNFQIPSYCPACDLMFPGLRVSVPGGRIETVGMGTSCRRCGGSAQVMDGTYALVGDAVRRLADGLTIDDILRLQKIIDGANQRHSTVEQVAEALQEDSNLAGFATWLKTIFVPKSAGDFYAFVGVLLVLIPMYINQAPAPVTDERIAEIVSHAMVAAMEKSQAKAKAIEEGKVREKTSSKIERNSICPCKSGKRYKHCCGALK